MLCRQIVLMVHCCEAIFAISADKTRYRDISKFGNALVRTKKRSFLKRDPSIDRNDDGSIGGSWDDVPFATLEKTESHESDLVQTSMLSGDTL